MGCCGNDQNYTEVRLSTVPTTASGDIFLSDYTLYKQINVSICVYVVNGKGTIISRFRPFPVLVSKELLTDHSNLHPGKATNART